MTSVESTTSKVVLYDGAVYGIGTYASVTGFLYHRVQAGIDLTDCKVAVFDITGITSGTLSVDVQVSSSWDFTSSVSAFTTEPSLNMATASSYDESSNAALDATNKVLTEGDVIRIDLSSIPAGLGKCAIYLIGEPS